jgi:predicted transcriptional regulator
VDDTTINVTAGIVGAYVSNNSVGASDLPMLIEQIHGAIRRLADGPTEDAPTAKLEPAVSIKKSVTPDFIICLEDGKKFKSLKRHLRSHFDMSPDQYRAKWGLPDDYPMVAPNYSAQRSNLAKTTGLGLVRTRGPARISK